MPAIILTICGKPLNHWSGDMTTETIDATPSWSAILPLLLLTLESGLSEGRRNAREELKRMADLADRYVSASK